MTETIEFVYRDHNSINDPSSGDYEPEKFRIRALLRQIQASGGLAVTRATLEALEAVNPPSDYYQGIVLNDPDPTNNGYYYRAFGAWVWGRGFPDTLARFTVTGGTENAVTASIGDGVDPASVLWFGIIPTATNTGPVTLNGVPVVNVNGDALAAGEWPADRSLILTDEGSEYRLWSDPAIDAMLAQAIQLVDDATQLATPGDGTVTDVKVASGANIAATKLAYTATGWVGGVLRTIHDKLAEQRISVKDYDAVGDGSTDDTLAFQRAFADAKVNGREVYVPEGRYRITDTLLFDRSADGTFSPGLRMSGEGMYSSVLVNEIVAGGPTIDLTAGFSSTYMQGGYIRDLGFEENGSGVNSHGIRYRSCWHQTFENLGFRDLNGSGLKSVNTNFDADASAHVDFIQIRANGCEGPGIDNDSGSGGLALHRLLNCEIGDCGKNGTACMVLDGNIQFSAHMCSFASGGTNFPLVHIKSTTVRTRQIEFIGGEYGNNSGTHFEVEAVSSFHTDGIRHVRRAAEANSEIGYNFPDGVSLYSGILIENAELQIDDATPPWTWIKMGTGLDSEGYFVATRPNISNFAVGNTLHEWTSGAKQKQWQIQDSAGRDILSTPVHEQRMTVAVAGTVTPDFTLGEYLQIVMVGAGAYTIAAPVGGTARGRRVTITILKDVSHTVSWNAIYQAPTMPDAGGTWDFIYDSTSGAWRVVL